MNRFVFPGFGIAVLLLVFCFRIWDVAPTHTDDAIWRIGGHQGNWQVVVDWAKSQGRIFAFVSGSLIYVGTTLQGSTLGPLLHVGAFALFFLGFHGLLCVYFNTKLAMLTAIANLALFAIRWEGSIVTTYPLFSWVLGTVFVASVYCGWQFSKHRRIGFLCTSLLLLYVSLNIHEGMSLLFSFLATLAVVANYGSSGGKRSHQGNIVSNPLFVRQISGTVGVIVLYFGGYIAWRLANPSQYDGNKFGSFNPIQVAQVLFSLSASGTVLTDCFIPYRVNFADAIGHDGYGIAYQPLKYLAVQGNIILALLCGVFATTATLTLSGRWSPIAGDSQTRCHRLPGWFPCILTGVSIAVIPVLPVAFVGKYQEQFYKLDVRSYAFTPICHFGWSLILAFLISQTDRLKRNSIQRTLSILISVCMGVMCYCATLRNEAAVADIRRETCRWKVVDQIASILPRLERTVTAVHVPRLPSGSWFTVVTTDYWSNYMQKRFHQTLRFDSTSIARSSIGPGLAYVDYYTAKDNRQSIVFAALLDVEPKNGQVIAREIGVASTGLDPSDRAQYQLNYRDLDLGSVSCRFSQMSVSNEDKHIRLLRNVRAVPSSIHISQHSEVHDLNIECGEHATLNIPIRFGLESGRLGGESGAKWLVGGWHPQERSGTWSSEKSSKLHVPLKAEPGDKFSVKVIASTLTGLGFYDQPQTVRLKIGDRIVASQGFVRGSGFLEIPFDMDQSDLTNVENLVLEVEVEDILNPAKLGISADTRNLGVMIQNLTVRRRYE